MELFIGGRKLIFLLFLSQNLTSKNQNILNFTHYLIMKTTSKQELKIIINHSSDTDPKDFMILEKKSTTKPFSF